MRATNVGAGKLFITTLARSTQRVESVLSFATNFNVKAVCNWNHGRVDTVTNPFPSDVTNQGKQVTGGLFLDGRGPNEKKSRCHRSGSIERSNNKQEHDKPFF